MNVSFKNSLPAIKRKLFFLIIAMVVFCTTGFSQEKNEAWYIANAPFKMPSVKTPEFLKNVYSVKDYGAIPDGQTLNTSAFEKAIEACAGAGGGTVEVPPGLWLTGPIQLKSNINFRVERGALILFTTDHTQYPMIPSSNSSSSYVPASPIYGYDLKNIAITGDGIIDGAGDSWRPVKKEKTTESQWRNFVSSGGAISKDGKIWWPTKEAMDGEDFLKDLKQKNSNPSAADYEPARDFLRPYMLYLVNCENVLLENITLRNSPKFVFYPNHCNNLTMRGVTIFNEWWAQNGDGIDISACKNVMIYKCTVSAGDDGICMKSGGSKNDAAGSFNLENVIVAGCNVYHAHGGFVIGSNTDGGMRNIFVSNCNFDGTDAGIRVKSNAGRGGLVKDIFIDNIFMSAIVNDAVVFDTYYEDMPAGSVKDPSAKVVRDKIPEFTDFHISNVFCNGAKKAISITGLTDMPVHNIYFEHLTISADAGLTATDAAALDLKNVQLTGMKKDPVNSLERVKGFTISNGYFPPSSKIFIKADAGSSGVKVEATDLRDVKDAVQDSAN
jgi:polygalacturonase